MHSEKQRIHNQAQQDSSRADFFGDAIIGTVATGPYRKGWQNAERQRPAGRAGGFVATTVLIVLAIWGMSRVLNVSSRSTTTSGGFTVAVSDSILYGEPAAPITVLRHRPGKRQTIYICIYGPTTQLGRPVAGLTDKPVHFEFLHNGSMKQSVDLAIPPGARGTYFPITQDFAAGTYVARITAQGRLVHETSFVIEPVDSSYSLVRVPFENCFDGKWFEINTLDKNLGVTWEFGRDQSGLLSIRRNVGDFHAALAWDDEQWTGDLWRKTYWDRGFVIYAADASCTRLATNRPWSYERVQ